MTQAPRRELPFAAVHSGSIGPPNLPPRLVNEPSARNETSFRVAQCHKWPCIFQVSERKKL